MRRTVLRTLLCLLLALALFAAGGCRKEPSFLLSAAVYPEMPSYPEQGEEQTAWRAAVQALRPEPGFAEPLTPFLQRATAQFLPGEAGENSVFSPVSLYLALGLLAELTEGESRAQLLGLLGAEDLAALRETADTVFRAAYRDDGLTTSVLASSLWLDASLDAAPIPLETLAESWHASSFQGSFVDEAYRAALTDWLTAAAGGLGADDSLPPDARLVIFSCLDFAAQWRTPFADPAPGVFSAPDGAVTCDFLQGADTGGWFAGEHFTAAARPLENGGGALWFLLPEPGLAPEDLLRDAQALAFLTDDAVRDTAQRAQVTLQVPVFDVSASQSLLDGLRALGLTAVLDEAQFLPMTDEPLHLSQAAQALRVCVDATGVRAAGYTALAASGTGAELLPDRSLTLDRPFLFCLVSDSGLPLALGCVNHPA